MCSFSRRLVFVLLKYHCFFISLAVYLSIQWASAFFSYSIEHDHAMFLMHLNPMLDDMKDECPPDDIIWPDTFAPFYTEIHKHPTFRITTYNDLLGHIDIYRLKGLEKLERSLFYNMMDFAVVFVATNYVIDSGDILPKNEHCILIFRTLIQYRDQSWQSSSVHSIHRALDTLNDELIRLLVEYYAFDKYNSRMITVKDLNVLALKHSFIAEALGLAPVDFAWGHFTPIGLQEYKYFNTWFTMLRKDKIKEEMLLEYIFCDIDLITSYLERKIEENVRMYSRFMAQKFALEALDLKLFGKRGLSYKDIVHYRTYAGDDFLYRYGFVKSYINSCIMIQDNLVFFRDFEAYRRAFDPDANKGFYDELSDKVEIDMARKREAYRDRLYYKK